MRRNRPEKEGVGGAANQGGPIPCISDSSCLRSRLSSCLERDLNWLRVKSVMVSLAFSTHLTMQNICQVDQPSDNFNNFDSVEKVSRAVTPA